MTRRLVAAVVVALAVHAPGARADERSMTARVSGNVTIRFHGCVAVDQCGVSGTMVWQPSRRGTFGVDATRKRVETHLLLAGSETQARVRRAGDTCRDSARDPTAAIDVSGAAVGLRPHGGPVHSIPVTNCAGPLDRDIRHLLPLRRIPLARLRRGETSVSLRSTRGFAAGGLTGTVRSTVTVHLGRPRVLRPGPTRPPLRVRTLRLTFRIVAVRGSIRATFGTRANRCARLGACGMTGAATIAPTAPRGSFVFEATARAGRPARDLRAALGLGRGRAAGVQVEAYGLWHGIAATEDTISPDGARCHDRVPLDGAQQSVVDVLVGSGRVAASYAEWGDTDPDALRTHCPGPSLDDLAGDQPLAFGSIPLTALRHRRVVLTLHRSTPFDDNGPWIGATSSRLEFVLERR